MAGYIVAHCKITNPEGYENYVPSIMGTFEPHNCEILVADYESETPRATRPLTACKRFRSIGIIGRSGDGSECVTC
jgi:uncharacterized protein (DUF1330 family)